MSGRVEKIKRHPWIIVNDINGIPSLTPRKTDGYVYCIEYGDHVKIGMSKDIITRIRTLKSAATNYGGFGIGRIAYTLPHEKYRSNEKVLHKFYRSLRVRGELFAIPFDHILWHNLPIDLSVSRTNRNPSQETSGLHDSDSDKIDLPDISDLIRDFKAAVAKIESATVLMEANNRELRKAMHERSDGLIDARSLTIDELNAMSGEDISIKVLFPMDIIESAVVS